MPKKQSEPTLGMTLSMLNVTHNRFAGLTLNMMTDLTAMARNIDFDLKKECFKGLPRRSICIFP